MHFFRFKLSLYFLLFQSFVFAQQNIAPILSATGNQVYCPRSSQKIVTNFTIFDPDDTGIDALFVQISTDYEVGNDQLVLTGFHPNISTSWDVTSGKLSLFGTLNTQPSYLQLINAVKAIEYSSSSLNPFGQKSFSITIGQANYLPLTQHYYQFIPNLGVTWTNAKTLAEAATYYGLQGYLATITSQEEAVIAGEQSNGAGWIGGSDAAQEGIWKWVTGPEMDTVFWNGAQSGSSPNFAYWNANEPNNLGNENYAHITASGVGSLGSWNDLSNTGSNSGNYQPKGYIVEFGGMPGDPTLQISTSTKISIPSINPLTTYSNCGPTSFTLLAGARNGTVHWYADPTGGIPLEIGESFVTPILTQTKTYYLDAYPTTCTTATRIPLKVTINQIPVVTPTNPSSACVGFTTTITATASIGEIYWYETDTSITQLAIGTSFTTPILSANKTYYVTANNRGCFANTRIPIEIILKVLPEILDETIEICEDETVLLSAKIPNYSYLWSTGEITQTIQSTKGLLEYSVVITSSELCSKTKKIKLIENPIPIIKEIIFGESSIKIQTQNLGKFEYSLDGIRFQVSNEFFISETGTFVAYVRDFNNCGGDRFSFVFISIPKFFSPNNDGFNDFFDVNAFAFYPKMKIEIYDRFGKLITQLSQLKTSWNGTWNGKPLPADDYWYIITFDVIKTEKKGHFSLKR